MKKGLTPAVQEVVRDWWEAREEGRLPGDRVMDEALARAIQADLEACPDYLPSHDCRVDWARSIVRGRCREDRPRTEWEMERLIEFFLGRLPECVGGKMAAAGD
jgi:hypothetical protein